VLLIHDRDATAVLLAAVAFKLLLDFWLVARSARMTGDLKVLKWYLPVMMLYPPYMMVVALGMFLPGNAWKGRAIR
jgi:hypothetical protein